MGCRRSPDRKQSKVFLLRLPGRFLFHFIFIYPIVLSHREPFNNPIFAYLCAKEHIKVIYEFNGSVACGVFVGGVNFFVTSDWAVTPLPPHHLRLRPRLPPCWRRAGLLVLYLLLCFIQSNPHRVIGFVCIESALCGVYDRFYDYVITVS